VSVRVEAASWSAVGEFVLRGESAGWCGAAPVAVQGEAVDGDRVAEEVEELAVTPLWSGHVRASCCRGALG
jgi:hypothetical protein